MKNIALLLSSIQLFGCSQITKLNNRIYQAQIAHIKVSPYHPRGMADKLKNQKGIRKKGFEELIKNSALKGLNRQDTVYLHESYSTMCSNCSSEILNILMGKTLITATRDINTLTRRLFFKFDTSTFNFYSTDKDYQEKFAAFFEMKYADQHGQDWAANPLDQGVIKCDDGSSQMLTAVYPNGQIKTFYACCWMSKSEREDYKEWIKSRGK